MPLVLLILLHTLSLNGCYKIAGEAPSYRPRARGWIRSLEVIIESSVPDEPREIFPAFVHVPSGRHHEEGVYVPPERLSRRRVSMNEPWKKPCGAWKVPKSPCISCGAWWKAKASP